MAIKETLKMGDPLLYKIAEPIAEFNTPELLALLKDLNDTMYAMSGAGLAAPQIGVSKQVVIFEVKNNSRYPKVEMVPYTVLINPQITPLSEDIQEDWEGCLSVPGLRGWVPRYSHILYTGFDEKGHPISREVSGFHARVVQHECDHLQGILYPMRIRDIRKFGFSSVLFPEPQATN